MKSERFKVLDIDADGSVELANLDMRKRGVLNYTAWARCETPLKRGQVVHGGFDFDPAASLLYGKMPTFQPVSTVRELKPQKTAKSRQTPPPKI